MSNDDNNNIPQLTGDVTPIAEGVGDILKAFPKGSNKLFDACLGKKHADACRYRYLTAVQTHEDEKKIRSGTHEFLDGLLVPINVTTDTFQLPTPLEVKEQQETKNYVACLKQANEAIYEKQNQGIEADDNPLSEQFFSRWRSEAVHIANEDMQQLWGRLLTEEIITEGSVSLRTLDIMRNMTRRDAEIFEHACKYVVQGDLVAFDITITARHDLPMRGPVRPLDWSHFNPLHWKNV